MKILQILKNQYFWLGIILLTGLLVRLYKIDSPIADWHSWRQADTAAVTRNFIKEGFSPFLPRFDDVSGNAEDPIPNLGRYRFVEFPIYNIAVYPFYLLFGVDEKLHRLVSVFFSLGSLVFLYLITRRYTNIQVALLTGISFAILPFNVFFSRTTLPEPTLVFFCLGMLYFIDKWIWEERRIDLWLGLIFTATAFLIKPFAIFFALPLLYSNYKRTGKFVPSLKYLLVYAVALFPFIFWRVWILQHPEGIPASSWLLNGDGIRFRPAFWWWILSQRIGGEILGVVGAVLFFIGLLIKPRSGNYFLHIWALSSFLFIIVFATGNVRHNYYQIFILPITSIFLSLGFFNLVKGIGDFIPRIWTIILALLFFPLTFYFGWVSVKEFYKINNPVIIEAGKRADQILPKNAVVVAPYNGDTAFLYHINRPGWPYVAFPITDLISIYNVTHYVSTNRDSQTVWVMDHYKVLEETPKFVIVDLTKQIKKY